MDDSKLFYDYPISHKRQLLLRASDFGDFLFAFTGIFRVVTQLGYGYKVQVALSKFPPYLRCFGYFLSITG